MRMLRSRRLLVALVVAMLAIGGVSGALAASSGATRPVATSAAAAPLGSVTALAWGVQTPVGARLVLRPSASFDLPTRALRVLRATKPRLTGLFVARILTSAPVGQNRKRAPGFTARIGGKFRTLGVQRAAGAGRAAEDGLRDPQLDSRGPAGHVQHHGGRRPIWRRCVAAERYLR